MRSTRWCREKSCKSAAPRRSCSTWATTCASHTSRRLCSSAAAAKRSRLLAGHEDGHPVTAALEGYGFHLGMAYQVVDDILDFTGVSAELGKPAQADMQLGLATAPILYASDVLPALKPYIQRRFKKTGDVAAAVALAQTTDCVSQSYKLAGFHADSAEAALKVLPDSQWKDALVDIVQLALSRKK